MKKSPIIKDLENLKRIPTTLDPHELDGEEEKHDKKVN